MRTITCLALFMFAACGEATRSEPDAQSHVPHDPRGTFAMRSRYDLALPAGIVDQMLAATDDPDDPARFVVDWMIATMPDGTVKTYTTKAAPYVAAYLEARIDRIAPKLADGLRTATTRLAAVARHLETVETLDVGAQSAARTIRGITWTTDVAFADHGIADASAIVNVVLDEHGGLAIGEQAIALPYGRLLRLGLDESVVPSIDASAVGIAGLLHHLVDCEQVGELVAAALGFGSPTFYASACEIGLTAAAGEIVRELEATPPIVLSARGVATGRDDDGDDTMDTIENGSWLGEVRQGDITSPLVGAHFESAH